MYLFIYCYYYYSFFGGVGTYYRDGLLLYFFSGGGGVIIRILRFLSTYLVCFQFPTKALVRIFSQTEQGPSTYLCHALLLI